MSKMFDSQVKHYRDKFNSIKDGLSAGAILSSAKGNGIMEDSLKTGLLENSEEFRLYCYKYAKTLMPGRVSCTTYAAVVAKLAEHFGIAYITYVGFCLPKSNERYAIEKSGWDKRKAESGEEHPMFANHVYLKINNKEYEYFNGDTTNIDHIDCIVM